MKNLRRALRMALRYRWSLVFSTISAILVAVLWSVNIGGVLPIIEVVFKNQSMHDLVDNRIATSLNAAAEAEREIQNLKAQIAAVGPDQALEINRQIALKQGLREAEKLKAARTRAIEPWIKCNTPNDAFQTLLIVFGFLFLCTMLRCFFLGVNMYLVARIGQRTILDIQQHLFHNVLQMETRELNVKGTGDLISRVRGETTSIAMAITTLFGKTLREPLKMGACIAGAAWVNWRLLLFSLVIVPVAGFAMLTIARWTKRAHKRAVVESAKLLDRLFQAVSYMRLVKASNMQPAEHQRFSTVATDVYRKAMRISMFHALGRTNNEILGVTIISMSAIAGAYLVLNQTTVLFGVQLSATQMTVSEMMLFFALLIGVADPLRKMGDVYNLIQSGAVAADRVFPIYDQIPDVRDPAIPKSIDRQNTNISFDDVNFSYELPTRVLKNLTLDVPSQTSLAIVGANGCGKSTLVNLLLRFFDTDQGSIRIGQHDVRDYRLHELRDCIGYVTQQTMLFNDTIANNIRYGRPDATDAQVIDAARKAHAHHFISGIENGYASMIGEHGGKLSGGQRQRLALARAILKDPPILVLDEATSQIDPESEQLIHQSLSKFIHNRTTLMVTHRLSTLELADRILVMSEGQVVDCGTHHELLARCSAYQRLRSTHLKEAA